MIEKIKHIAITLLIILSLVFLVDVNNKFILERAVNEDNIYTNEIDGYKYIVPDGYIIDENFYPYSVRLVSDNCTIELYTENCKNSDEVLSYINYTNQAITGNDIDYFGIKQTKHRGNTILCWSRRKLSKIENDKNYYLKIDVPKNERVYTILVKSTFHIDDYKQYINAFIPIKTSNNEYPALKIKCTTNKKFNPETAAFYNQYFENSTDTEWGIYQYDYMESDELYKIENQINHNFKLLLLYTEFEKFITQHK